MELTPDDLLEGAVLALDHAGRFIADACDLARSGSIATAVIAVTYGAEELGRSSILFGLSSTSTTPVSARRVKRQLEPGKDSHARKLLRGLTGITRRTGRRSPSGPKSVARAMYGSRMRALYVDLREDGWNRPQELERDGVRALISDACTDYANTWQRAYGAGLLANAAQLRRGLPEPLTASAVMQRWPGSGPRPTRA